MKYFKQIGIGYISLVVLLSAVTQITKAQETKDVYISSSNLNSQSVNLNSQSVKAVSKGTSLKKIFSLIEEEYNVNFFYQSGRLADKAVAKSRELYFGNSVFKVLAQLLEGTELTYKKLTHRTLGIIHKNSDHELNQKINFELVTGTVTDGSTGNPLPGVNVKVKGTTTGTATDTQGQYELTVGSLQDTLVFSFIGYQIQNVPINGRTTIDVSLNTQVISGEEMVVVGYGTQERRDITGAISQISTEDLQSRPVTRIDQGLQGLAAGLKVTQGGGVPGGDINVRIRGTSSISAGSDPLYVIDGVPGGDINSVSPNDVKSIEVLKDASATAIYGSRGSGGVVLISTKQGEAREEPQIDFNVSYGFQNVRNKLDLLNAEQYASLANDANINIGQPPVYENPESLGDGTDWQDEVFRTSARQDYQVSISGGSQDIQYFISGGYLDENGTVKNSFFNRGQIRINLNANVSDQLTIGENLTLSRINKNQFGGRSVRNALLFKPTQGVRNQNGEYTQNRVPQLDLENPIAGLEEPRINQNNTNALGNVFARYDLLDNHLEIRASIGGNYKYLQNKEYTPTTLLSGQVSGGEATVLDRTISDWVSRNTITYNNTFNNKHEVKLLGGYTLQNNDNSSVQTGASQFPNESLGYNNLSVGEVRSIPQTTVTESIIQSFLFRTNYVFNTKYLLTATGRYDGSSKFGEGNRYGFFPSGSIGWRLSEEKFLENLDALSSLKLRVSYGKTGNQDIGAYSALAALVPTTTILGNTERIGVEPTSISNPNLKWEQTTEFDVGVDASLFSDRLSITADYYKKKTSDLLLAVQLPSQTGFTSTIRNIGEIENKGFELSISGNTSIGSVGWKSTINVTQNKNIVNNLGGEKEIFPGLAVAELTAVNRNTIIIRKNESLGSFYGYVFDGLFQTESEIQNSAQPNAELGTPHYRDLNKDGVINETDKQIIGNGQPDVYGSFSSTFSYKGFQLDLRLDGSFGNDILNSSRLELESVNGAYNNLDTVRDRWTPENTNTDIPKANASGYTQRASTRFIEDGSYVRLQHISLSYSIPSRLIGTARNLSVYVTGTNLYTFTDYSGYDPEINFQNNSNVAFSIDYNPYPRSRTFTFGIRLGL